MTSPSYFGIPSRTRTVLSRSLSGPACSNDLRRLQAAAILDGGPFVAYADHSNTAKKRAAIVKDAEIPHITIHDLRRTGITRALLAGVPPITVQKLAGHRNITTTMRYYAEVNN